MNPLFVTVLFIMGTVYGDTSSCSTEWQGISFTVYVPDSSPGTYINISDTTTNLDCTWGGSPCYIVCEFPSAFRIRTCAEKNNTTVLNTESHQLTFVYHEFQSKCTVTMCNISRISELMKNISQLNSTPSNLKTLLNIKDMCVNLFQDVDLIHQYITLEKKCIHDIISIPFTGKMVKYDLENLAVTVVRMDMNTTKNSFENVFAPSILDLNLPVHVLIPAEPFLNVLEEQSKLGVVTYASAQQFIIGQQNVYIASAVIRLEVVGRNIINLRNPLQINFTVNTSVPQNFCLSCQYYDDSVYHWKDQPCINSQDYNNDSKTVMCSYDHMTPFAVLLIDVKIEKSHWDILSYISYIGCSLSAFFSAASVLLFMVKRTPNADSSNSIHVSLSAALFFLNISFLFSEWAAKWSINGLCVFVAVVIQYSLLCSFSWMAIEGMHLYLLLVKVFNTYIQYYMIKLSLFGWGVPAVLVGASLSVYNFKSFYGTKTVTFSDNSEEQICWITDVYFLYGMNLVYFSFTFLSNTVILLTVICQITKLRRLGATGSKLPTCKEISTVMGLTCLLGMTWGLAFFTTGYTNYPVLYVFCICNTLQGLFMFLWVYGTMRRNRRQAAQSLPSSSPYSSTDKSQKTRPAISHHS